MGLRRDPRLGSRGHHEPGREPAVVDAREELLDLVPAVGHLPQQGTRTVVVPVEEHPRLVVHLHPGERREQPGEPVTGLVGVDEPEVAGRDGAPEQPADVGRRGVAAPGRGVERGGDAVGRQTRVRVGHGLEGAPGVGGPAGQEGAVGHATSFGCGCLRGWARGHVGTARRTATTRHTQAGRAWRGELVAVGRCGERQAPAMDVWSQSQPHEPRTTMRVGSTCGWTSNFRPPMRSWRRIAAHRPSSRIGCCTVVRPGAR